MNGLKKLRKSLSTNRFCFQPALDVIKRDFIFVKVKAADGKDLKKQYRSILAGDYKARAAAYLSGSVFYLMYGRSEFGSCQLEQLRNDLSSMVVSEVNPMEEWRGTEARRWLLQLFINYLNNTSCLDKFVFNNIEGASVVFNNQWKRDGHLKIEGVYHNAKVRFGARLAVDNDFIIYPQTVTYLCPESVSLPRIPYVFKGNKLQKMAKRLEPGSVWFQKGEYKVKSLIPFFLFSSYNQFLASKMGVMYHLLLDMKMKPLAKYVMLSQRSYQNVELYEMPMVMDFESVFNERILPRFRSEGLNIVNVSADDHFEDCLSWVADCLNREFKIDCSVGSVDSKRYNLLLHHDAAFYDDGHKKRKAGKGGKDPVPDFVRKNAGNVMQGLCIERVVGLKDTKVSDVVTQLKPILKNVLVSLVIKDDIANDLDISLACWADFHFQRDFSFVIYVENKYYVMTVSPEGKVDYDCFSDADLALPPLYQSISEAFTKQENGKSSDIEMVVFEEGGPFYQIATTAERTMPDILSVGQALCQAKGKMDKLEFLKEVHHCLEVWLPAASIGDKPSSEDLNRFLKNLDVMVEAIKVDSPSYKELYKCMIPKTYKKISTLVLLYFLNEKNIMLDAKLRNGSFDEKFGYQMRNLQGTCWFKTPVFDASSADAPLAGDGSSYSFYVGAKGGLNTSLDKGCVIRTISRSDGKACDEAFLERLFQLIPAEFVRMGQFSVLPFPRRYLNEFRSLLSQKVGELSESQSDVGNEDNEDKVGD